MSGAGSAASSGARSAASSGTRSAGSSGTGEATATGGRTGDGHTRRGTISTGVHDVPIVADAQRGFSPQGTLPASGGDEVTPVINRATPHFGRRTFTLDRFDD